eukprot:TRINITY_DN2305_c0_g1_i4.p1 TRINITY_DN2305_c0_g1~~TRINITY_DN2305_c0_g1_i4.p1  ORF type:complete len:169 (+),score=12.41 TRINITY_DN2305_c0_g1_i4:171-677(+)
MHACRVPRTCRCGEVFATQQAHAAHLRHCVTCHQGVHCAPGFGEAADANDGPGAPIATEAFKALIRRAQDRLVLSWACLRIKHVVTRPAVQMLVEVMHRVFGEVHEGFIKNVCSTLSSLEERSTVLEMGVPANDLFADSMTAKRRETAVKRLLDPLNIKVRLTPTLTN